MVRESKTQDSGRLPSGRKGQLVLVGGVVIAMVIIALSVIVNSVLFTQNMGASSVSEDVEEVNEFRYGVGKATRSVGLRVNHEDRNRTDISDVENDLEPALNSFSDGLQRSYATSGSVYANVAYNDTEKEGTRVVQPEDNKFTGHSGPVVNGADDIGWFTVNLNIWNMSDDQGTISVEGASDTLEYDINRTDKGNANVTLVVSDSGGQIESVNFTSAGGRSMIDLRNGGVSWSNTTFTGFGEYLDSPDKVDISNGGNLYGKYSIVTKDNGNFGYGDCTPGTQICHTPVVWEAKIDLSYDSKSVDYENHMDVSIYGGEP